MSNVKFHPSVHHDTSEPKSSVVIPRDDLGRSLVSRCRAFFFALSLLAIIWLLVLPAIGKIPSVDAMIRRHDAAGIDPSVMFYSEIEHLEYRDGMLRLTTEAAEERSQF